jgi:hypothetical protein
MMQSVTKEPSPISLSLSIYQLLIATYPAGFRREYGPHMAQVFRDYSLRVYRLDGTPGLLRLWILTLLDYLKSVVEEHMQQGVHMSKSKFIRLSGWAFALGAIAFMVVLVGLSRDVPEYSRYNALSQPIDLYFEYATAVLLPSSMFLWLIGLIGLYLRYSEEINVIGKISLASGMLGAGINFLITVLWAFQVNLNWDDWGVFVGSLSLFSLSLVVFGIISIRDRLLPRWNALPILAGSWVLIFWLMNIPGLVDYFENVDEQLFVSVVSMISMIGLAAMGVILGSDSREMESAT